MHKRKQVIFSAVGAAILVASTVAYANAQFYAAHCDTENKDIGGYVADKTIAQNDLNAHLRKNPTHSGSIASK